jgi:hypothetical protein
MWVCIQSCLWDEVVTVCYGHSDYRELDKQV